MSSVTKAKKFAYGIDTIDGTFKVHNQPLKAETLREAIYETIDNECRINVTSGLGRLAHITVYMTMGITKP